MDTVDGGGDGVDGCVVRRVPLLLSPYYPTAFPREIHPLPHGLFHIHSTIHSAFHVDPQVIPRRAFV